MKKTLILVLFLGLLAPSSNSEESVDLNRVVLRVNDEIATLYDYQKRLEERVIGIRGSSLSTEQKEELLSSAPQRAMYDIMEELLLLSRAEQLAIRVEREDVEAAINRSKKDMQLETDEDLRRALAVSGLTLEAYRTRLKRNLRIQHVMAREIHGKIDIPDEELHLYYRDHPEEFALPEERQVREIIVLEKEEGSLEGLAEVAERIQARLAAGEPLETVAEDFSARGETTGLINHGWVDRGMLASALADAVWDLPKGGFSEPVEGRGGLHILEQEDQKPSSLRPFSEVQEAIREKKRNERFKDAYSTFMINMRNSSEVVVNVPPEAEGFEAFRDA